MQHAVLTLIRHGETTGNLNRLLQGITDSPLTVFGQAQVNALAQAWKTTLTPDAAVLDLPPPTLIVCSPIGRARKTAEAMYAACVAKPLPPANILEPTKAGRFQSLPSRQDVLSKTQTLELTVDFGLAERDFGYRESTRGGVHVAGFPRGQGSGESKADFAAKVKSVGLEWLQAAVACPDSPTHIVLVTHGMWISTFLHVHAPAHIVPGDGGTTIPFAANTGIFSLKVSREGEGHKMVTELIKANDTRHLASVKRQKGGFGRAAFDPTQSKLASFFTKSTSDANSDERPHKKKKQ